MVYNKTLLIGVDLGTTGVRSIAYDTDLHEIGSQYYEYPLISRSPKVIEQDANLWWDLVLQSIRMATASFGKANACSICLSTQGIAFLPVARNGTPIGNAISWLDRRADEEATALLEQFGAHHIYGITGKRLNEVYVLPKLMWMRQHMSDVFTGAHAFTLAHDYIIGRMTGRRIIDRTLASGTMLYDIHTLRWSQQLLDAACVTADRLPEVCRAGTPVGPMLESVSASLGLPAKTIVINGAQDQKCAALGAGISQERATLSLGTAAALSMLHCKPYADDQMRIPCFAGIEDNTWITEGVISTAAAALKWLRNTFFPSKSYDELSVLAAQHTQDDLFFYPHLAGASSPQWFANASGCFHGITLETQAANIVHAVFEGISFQIKSNLAAMRTDQSLVRAIRVFGGGANSDYWCQAIANTTGLTVEVPRSIETACMGAAMLAWMGISVHPNTGALRDSIQIRSIYTPNIEACNLLNERYNRYCEVEHRMWG